ncbi:MAG: TolC family protein [Clostridiales bacterium]|nr:TolC family protein [Clostridiales bacterium]
MKRKISAFLAALMVFVSSSSVFGAVSDITINANGLFRPIRNEMINRNGANLIGLREISDILGADDVFWDSKARTVTIKKNGKKAVLSVDSGKVSIDGKETDAPVSAEIVDSRVMVPLRFISEIFDAEVTWDGEKRTITVVTPDKTSDYTVLDIMGENVENTIVYTYDEALQSAINKNSDLKNLDDTISYLIEARSELGNNIKIMDDAYESYTMLENSAAEGEISDSMTVQARMSETIDTTIKLMQSMKSADVNRSLRDVNEEMIKDGLAATLKNYLSSIKTAQMNISLLEENVKLGQENIENMELKLSVGMESEKNVSTAKLEQKELEANLESSKLAFDKLKQSLRDFIGAKPDENIYVDYEITFDKLDDVQLESYVTLKTQNDPSIKALKAKAELAEYNKRVASVTASDAERMDLTNAVNTAERALKDAQDDMATNIRNAYNSIRQLEQQNKAKKAAVQKAIETYNSVVVSYQAGMATNYQVSQAKLGILNAEIDVEKNALDYDLSVFTFERPYMLKS